MQNSLKKLLIKTLQETLDKIKDDTCEISDDEADDIISLLFHKALSKEEACDYLNCSRATFDNAVKDGKLPKGRKRKGRKELVWYKDELRNILKR